MRIQLLARAWRTLLIPAAVLLLSGCQSRDEGPVRVFAAASLREAFTEIGRRFEETHPGRKVDFDFAGSQVLAAQIEQGAPADVYASADTELMEALHKKHLVEPSVIFTHNRMVVITPRQKSRVQNLKDLAADGVRLVVADENVPAGKYARRAITALSATGEYGAEYQRLVTKNIVSGEPNVRSVLAKVALGEADAGIVYITDVSAQPGKLLEIAIPDRYNPTADYSAAVVTAAKRNRAAHDFIHLVAGAEGQEILARHGFGK